VLTLVLLQDDDSPLLNLTGRFPAMNDPQDELSPLHRTFLMLINSPCSPLIYAEPCWPASPANPRPATLEAAAAAEGDFDANVVAQLDFDQFDKQDMCQLLRSTGSPPLFHSFLDDDEQKISSDDPGVLKQEAHNQLSSFDDEMTNEVSNRLLDNNAIDKDWTSEKMTPVPEYMFTFNNELSQSSSQSSLTTLPGKESLSSQSVASIQQKIQSLPNLELQHSIDANLANFMSTPADTENFATMCSKFPTNDSLKKYDKVENMATCIPKASDEIHIDEACDDNQSPNFRPQPSRVDDYEYSELYINGKYIDMNQNELGFVSPEVKSWASNHSQAGPSKVHRSYFDLKVKSSPSELKPDGNSTIKPIENDTCSENLKKSFQTSPIAPDKMVDLSFMDFPFEVPKMFRPLAHLEPVDFNKPPQLNNGLISVASVKQPDTNWVPNPPVQNKCPLPALNPFMVNNTVNREVAENESEDDSVNRRDSGLGGSCTQNQNVPVKRDYVKLSIEDWESLLTLLPSNVAKTCQFFKGNTAQEPRFHFGSAYKGLQCEQNPIATEPCNRNWCSSPCHDNQLDKRLDTFYLLNSFISFYRMS